MNLSRIFQIFTIGNPLTILLHTLPVSNGNNKKPKEKIYLYSISGKKYIFYNKPTKTFKISNKGTPFDLASDNKGNLTLMYNNKYLHSNIFDRSLSLSSWSIYHNLNQKFILKYSGKSKYKISVKHYCVGINNNILKEEWCSDNENQFFYIVPQTFYDRHLIYKQEKYNQMNNDSNNKFSLAGCLGMDALNYSINNSCVPGNLYTAFKEKGERHKNFSPLAIESSLVPHINQEAHSNFMDGSDNTDEEFSNEHNSKRRNKYQTKYNSKDIEEMKHSIDSLTRKVSINSCIKKSENSTDTDSDATTDSNNNAGGNKNMIRTADLSNIISSIGQLKEIISPPFNENSVNYPNKLPEYLNSGNIRTEAENNLRGAYNANRNNYIPECFNFGPRFSVSDANLQNNQKTHDDFHNYGILNNQQPNYRCSGPNYDTSSADGLSNMNYGVVNGVKNNNFYDYNTPRSYGTPNNYDNTSKYPDSFPYNYSNRFDTIGRNSLSDNTNSCSQNLLPNFNNINYQNNGLQMFGNGQSSTGNYCNYEKNPNYCSTNKINFTGPVKFGTGLATFSNYCNNV